MFFRVLSLAAFMTASSQLMAQVPTPRQPTGPWIVGYEEGMCLLQRDFGSASQPVTLSFRQVPTVSKIRVVLVDSVPAQSAMSDVRVGFGGGAEAVKASLSTYRSTDRATRYNETELDRAALSAAAQTGVLTFDAGGALQYDLAVPSLGKALAQVDACLADQIVEWGMSSQQLSTIAQFPTPRDDVLTSSEPFVLDSKDIQDIGYNVAYVSIDPAGQPSNCRVAITSGHASLDAASCDVLMAAKFKPAQSRTGQPTAGIYAHPFRWRTAQ